MYFYKSSLFYFCFVFRAFAVAQTMSRCICLLLVIMFDSWLLLSTRGKSSELTGHSSERFTLFIRSHNLHNKSAAKNRKQDIVWPLCDKTVAGHRSEQRYETFLGRLDFDKTYLWWDPETSQTPPRGWRMNKTKRTNSRCGIWPNITITYRIKGVSAALSWIFSTLQLSH